MANFFSIGCCSNVLKSVIQSTTDLSNVLIDLSNVSIDISNNSHHVIHLKEEFLKTVEEKKEEVSTAKEVMQQAVVEAVKTEQLIDVVDIELDATLTETK
jgi:hypothetical protein